MFIEFIDFMWYARYRIESMKFFRLEINVEKFYKKIFQLGMCAMLCACMGAGIHTAKASAKVSLKDADSKVKLKYDDRYEFKKEIEKVTTISVTSKDVKTQKKDKEVVQVVSSNKKKLVATGCGKALVELKNGKKVGIIVSPAKISLILLAGQSNMEGTPSFSEEIEKYKKQWIVNPAGTVYSTYAPSTVSHSITNGCFSKKSDKLTIWNTKKFVPDTLTDNSSKDEWKRTNNLTTNAKAVGKLGMDGALANEWVKKTGEKVWLVNASHSGSSISTWIPGKKRQNNNYWQAVTLYKRCEQTLNNEIKAGHYKLSHKGYFWLQGETDARDGMSAGDYLKNFMLMHNGFKKELAGNKSELYKYVNKKIEFAGICMVRAHGNPTDVNDLRMVAPRKVQYYLCNSSLKKYKDIFLASHVSEEWATDDGVKTYFTDKYKDVVTYLKQNPMKEGSMMPSCINDVHPKIHYTQLGYNEIGKDAADNICYALGYAKAPKMTTKIKLVASDGYNPISNVIKTPATDMTLTLKVFPSYKTKKIVYEKTKGVSLTKWKVGFNADKNFSGRLRFSIGSYKKNYYIWSEIGTTYLKSMIKTVEGVQLDWSKSDKANCYVVLRRKSGTSKWKSVKRISKNTLSFVDKTVKAGTLYEYTVRALDKNDNPGQSNVQSIYF